MKLLFIKAIFGFSATVSMQNVSHISGMHLVMTLGEPALIQRSPSIFPLYNQIKKAGSIKFIASAEGLQSASLILM